MASTRKKDKKPVITGELMDAKRNRQAETQFKPGVCANPNGRPKGSRNKLSEQVILDLLADWEIAGPSAIQACRLESPGVYLKVVASLIPKELKLSKEENSFEHIIAHFTDEQLAQFHELVSAIASKAIVVEGEAKAITGK